MLVWSRFISVLLVILTAFIAGCASTFTGYEPTAGEVCSEVSIERENGHCMGEHFVEFNGIRAEVRPAPCGDLLVRVPPGSSTGPLTVYQDSGAAAFIGFLSSEHYDLGTYTVTGPTPRPHGPCNVWWHADAPDVPVGACPAAGGGIVAVGSRAPNFTLFDQNGDEVELCQFYGRVIILYIFSPWCPSCEALAREMDAVWRAHADRGLVTIGIMDDGLTAGIDATIEEIEGMGRRVTYPMLGDVGHSQINQYSPGDPSEGKKFMVVIDQTMIVRRKESCPIGPCNWERALELLGP